MKKSKLLLLLFLGIAFAKNTTAHVGPNNHKSEKIRKNVRFRGGDCAAATKQIDQEINNVRARLLNGGDVWWDGNSNGRYIVPKVAPGQQEVSSLFAGAVWIGGFDPGGNLKLAAQTYGSGRGVQDYYPGPLNQFSGLTDKETCSNWDRFFKVTAVEIKEHLRLYNKSVRGEITYTEEMIPAGVKGWPSKGNPHFLDVWGFELPFTGQGLASSYDEDNDGLYNPLNGDFPVIEVADCVYDVGGTVAPTNECGEPKVVIYTEPQFPDEMIFWIYNDNGGAHSETNADAIQMEIQATSFAYATNDFINNMTFQRYKLINRAIEDISQCYFAMWVDPDLGCHTDDLIGSDTSRSLMYVYNQDAVDGQTGCSCPGGTATYCNDIPILGVDYFRGPQGRKICYDSDGAPMIDDFTGDTIKTLTELGMSSFTYYNNQDFGNPPAGTTDPQTADEFYNYITGRWRDGSPFQLGGCGYNTGGPEIDYAFTTPPDCTDPTCWNMCNDCNTEGDRRTLQATGPFTLKPGDINELIIGVVWLPEQDYPCPDISELQKADDVAQALFDNCFVILDGPDAPDVSWLELDQEVIGILTNDEEVSNNRFEQYSGIDLKAPQTLDEERISYRFEGYKVFQLENPNISVTELDDPAKAALVFQTDIDNEIGKIYNWEAVDNPNQGEPDIWVPEEEVMVPNPDQGIQRTFKISEDVFTQSTDTRLINHKKYYFTALAYAHNEWDKFEPFANGGVGSGQQRPYLEGRGNIKTYTVIPRPLNYEVLASEYGEGVEITRIDGVGAGTHFLDVSDEMREKMITPDFNHEITYLPGGGPFDITIFNPLDVRDGDFELTLTDENLNDKELDEPEKVNWQLTDLNRQSNVVVSDVSIEKLNEQLLPQYGFSIKLKAGLEPGNFVFDNPKAEPSNGAIGYEEEYKDPTGKEWLTGIPDDFSAPGIGVDIFDYTKTGPNEIDNALDSMQAFKQLGEGFFTPYYLLDYSNRSTPYISPVWKSYGQLVRGNMREGLAALNNVDIVFTSDKSKWSRCVVVESSVPEVTSAGFETEGNRKHFDLRAHSSVGKEDDNGDGFPDPDGDGEGMGWFPGYAVDVETGQRLNIFFGEASVYRCDESFFSGFLNACNSGVFENNEPTGADMMWNPTAQGGIENVPANTFGAWQAITGGMHFIYVTNEPYDGCEQLREVFKPGIFPGTKALGLSKITWAGYPLLEQGSNFLSYNSGLIPNDLTVKLRVDNSFKVEEGTGEKNGYPTYRFSLKDKEARSVESESEIVEALDGINIVPNPYYGFSPYETSQFSTTVKITNLPAKCEVNIYTLDGKFIRNYDRDEVGAISIGGNLAVEQGQVYPDLEWDLRNSKGIPVASGVYLIHVKAPGIGERVLKWFGIARQYDPSGL